MTTDKLRVLDLFSGIGGFSLGLERTGGFETVAFCEIEPFCRRVLAKHWPHVKRYEDVRELTADTLRRDGIAVDVICGGFPCQDISTAGKGAGLAGERSGLWSEIVRLARDIRPQFVIVENVAALLGRGLDRVLGDLAEIGFDAEWDCIPAVAIGAPHRRDRIWIVAYSDTPERRPISGARHGLAEQPNCVPQRQEGPGRSEASRFDVANSNADLHPRGLGAGADRGQASRGEGGDVGEGQAPYGERIWAESSSGRPYVADAERGRLQGRNVECAGPTAIVAAAYSRHRRGGEFGAPWWSEPDVGRVAYGVPAGMDRIRALGNAVVPQIPELIGRAILETRRAA